jgi:hypothetical protein
MRKMAFKIKLTNGTVVSLGNDASFEVNEFDDIIVYKAGSRGMTYPADKWVEVEYSEGDGPSRVRRPR